MSNMVADRACNVPVVDLSAFTSGSDIEAQKRAAKELATQAHINGCVGISNHGLSSERLASAFAMNKKLFDLPHEEKMKAPHPDAVSPHRGYSAVGRENAAAKGAQDVDDETQKQLMKVTDYKESYEIGSDQNHKEYNIWLPEEVFPGFRQYMTDFYWELNKLASAILEALIMSLDLTEDEANNVRALHTGHDNQLRLLHYLPISNDMSHRDENTSRLGAHTDWSSFTLLFQDSNGGLEFMDRVTGEFSAAEPRDGVLYMNIGDMFQRMSNGFYPSALHRVVVPNPGTSIGGNKKTPARYSIPYFVSPPPDGVVEPQPSRVKLDGKRVYEPITVREYSERMFALTNSYS